MSESLYYHEQFGPYQQALALRVMDKGNRLPVDIVIWQRDPHRLASHSMTVNDARLFYRKLGEAIEVAERAGLD